MNTCFFATPIGKNDFEDAVYNVLKEVLFQFDFNLVRSDEYHKSGDIPNQIIRHLIESELVIVDLTDSNANVFYELGIRHSTVKEVILISSEKPSSSGTKLPFDINHQRTIFYDAQKIVNGDTKRFKDDVTRQVKSFLLNKFDIVNPINRLDNIIPLDINGAPLEISIFKMIEYLSRGILHLNSNDLKFKRVNSNYSNKVLKAVVPIIIADMEQKLHKLFHGTVETWGYLNNTVYSKMIELVNEQFRAISVDDWKFWKSSEGQQYANYTKEKMDIVGIKVERIFAIISIEELSPQSQYDYFERVLLHQVGMGFRIRIAELNKIKSVANAINELDFGLFDDFAVSFFRFADGRSHKVDFSQEEFIKHSNYYDKVIHLCEPSGNVKDKTLFETREQLVAWQQNKFSKK